MRRATIRRGRWTYRLTGLGVCARCGGRLTILTGNGRPRLCCSSRRQAACASRSAVLALHEEQRARHLTTLTLPPDDQERRRVAVSDEAARGTDAPRHRRQLEARRARPRDLSLLSDLPKATCQAERDRRRRGLATTIADVAQGWGLAAQERRHRLAGRLVEEVVIDSEQVVAVKPRPRPGPILRPGLSSQRLCWRK